MLNYKSLSYLCPSFFFLIYNRAGRSDMENQILNAINPTQDEWQAAEMDSAILEQKISALVEEFENKHAPIQANVMTRHRPFGDLYDMKIGGAAQIKLHNTGSPDRKPMTTHSAYLSDPRIIVTYTTDPE